jgi:hypothetical protein
MDKDERIRRMREGAEKARENNLKVPPLKWILKQPILNVPNEGMLLAEINLDLEGKTPDYHIACKACKKNHPDWSRQKIRKYVLKDEFGYVGVAKERHKVHLRRSVEWAQHAERIQRSRQSMWLNRKRQEEAKRIKAEEEEAARLLAAEEARRAEEEAVKQVIEEPETIPFPEPSVACVQEPGPVVDHTAFIAAFKNLPAEAPADKQLAWVCAHPCLALAGQWDDDNPMPAISADDIADAPSRKAVTMLQYAMKHGEKFWSAIMSEDKKQGGKAVPTAVDDGSAASDEEMEGLMGNDA